MKKMTCKTCLFWHFETEENGKGKKMLTKSECRIRSMSPFPMRRPLDYCWEHQAIQDEKYEFVAVK